MTSYKMLPGAMAGTEVSRRNNQGLIWPSNSQLSLIQGLSDSQRHPALCRVHRMQRGQHRPTLQGSQLFIQFVREDIEERKPSYFFLSLSSGGRRLGAESTASDKIYNAKK